MKDRFTCEAFVLAGGKSSRMGTDKGLMDFNGKKMIEHVLLSLRIAARTTIISDNEAYNQFGYRVCADIHKNCGPLGGVHAGLSYADSDWCIALSCDVPFVTSGFLEFLLKNINGNSFNAIVPIHDHRAEPLCAVYHKSCLPEIEKQILKKEFKMHTLLQKLDTLYVEVPKEKFDADVLFRNINWPADIISTKYE